MNIKIKSIVSALALSVSCAAFAADVICAVAG